MGKGIYLETELSPKAKTTGDDIGRGSVRLVHLAPELFLELQQIKLHTHSGAESQQLAAEATPEAVRAFEPNERIERGVATWTGGAAAAGSVALTFGAPFQSAPEVFAIASDRGAADIIVTTSAPTATGVTLYWELTSGTETEVDITYLVIGR